MIVERTMSPDFLTNMFLVAARDGGTGFLVDAGGPVEPLLEAAAARGIAISHVLLTHHHGDHVRALGEVLEYLPDAEVLAHPEERVPGSTGDIRPDQQLTIGGLRVRAVHTPGHTAGMLAFVADGHAFVGDTLFKDSVGGVRAPGSTSYGDLKRSIMEVLLALPPETVIHPGHTDSTTVARELEHNPFVRIWQSRDPEGTEPCVALGDPATLVLWAPDYDGGHKAWVRWEDGRDDIVPGSRVRRG
jgi:hydroxyacylglutathione hydrolase